MSACVFKVLFNSRYSFTENCVLSEGKLSLPSFRKQNCRSGTYLIREKASVDIDSRTVARQVRICYEVCNPENEMTLKRRTDVVERRDVKRALGPMSFCAHLMPQRTTRWALNPSTRGRVEPTAGADLGSNSTYSNETFSDRGGWSSMPTFPSQKIIL